MIAMSSRPRQPRTAAARDDPGPGLGRTRFQVLSLLRDVGEPITVTEAARRLGLHANTVRFHLETLEEAGLVSRQPEERRGPGRPRLLYTATTAASAAEGRSYRFLAQVLTGFIAEKMPKPAKAAEEAGQAWGRFLTEPPPPYQKVGEPAAMAALVDNLDRIGFLTRPVDDDEGLRLEINHCPFLEVAREHADVVCAVHLGLLRGMLSEMRAPVSAKRLEPMVEPSRCIARLARR